MINKRVKVTRKFNNHTRYPDTIDTIIDEGVLIDFCTENNEVFGVVLMDWGMFKTYRLHEIKVIKNDT